MARVVRFAERGLAKMVDRVGTEKGRKSDADRRTETNKLGNEIQDRAASYARENYFSGGKPAKFQSMLDKASSDMPKTTKRISELMDASMTDIEERRKFESRTKGMKAGGKVRGAGCATKGKGKGTMR